MTKLQVTQKEPKASFTYEQWLRYQGLGHGIIRVDESIRENSTSRILGEIEEAKRRQLPEVTIIISSPGGGAYYAFAIYDAIKDLASVARTKAIVEGWAASAAAMIVLQAVQERCCRASARFLLHECRRWVFWAVERTSDLKDEVKEMDAITDRIVSILAQRCKKTKDEIENLIERKEVWMSASEAKDWGLIDTIL